MKLRADEDVIVELTPAGGLLGYWVITRCLVAGIAVGVAMVCLAFFGSGWGFTLGLGLAVQFACAGGLLVFTLAVIYAACLLRTYRYYVTNRRCAFSGGILLRVRHSIPYHKITDLEQRQNILQRLFGIWSLRIYTPGTSSGKEGANPELLFQGLSDPDEPTDAITDFLTEFRATGQ